MIIDDLIHENVEEVAHEAGLLAIFSSGCVTVGVADTGCVRDDIGGDAGRASLRLDQPGGGGGRLG